MGKHRLAFVAFDSAKNKHAVAIADGGRGAEVRYLGEIDNSPDAVRKLVAKLTRQYERLHFCYEAGPTGYGLHINRRLRPHRRPCAPLVGKQTLWVSPGERGVCCPSR
jgi:transposase